MKNWTSSKLQTNAHQETCYKNEKAGHRPGENIYNTYIKPKGFCPGYIKNSESEVKRQPNFKNKENVWTDTLQKRM